MEKRKKKLSSKMVQLYFLYQFYISFCHLLVAFLSLHKIKPDPHCSYYSTAVEKYSTVTELKSIPEFILQVCLWHIAWSVCLGGSVSLSL